MNGATDPGLPCVHCGLCLDTCPTYRVLGTEAESPRGRIYIMQDIRQGTLPLDSAAVAHLDNCLGCMACETACPSGVSYGERIEEFRPRLRAALRRKPWRVLVAFVSTNHRLFELGLAISALLDRIGLAGLRRRIPGLDIFPRPPETPKLRQLSPRARSRVSPPIDARLSVVLLTGCVGDRLKPEISRAAVEVLHHNGIAVGDDTAIGCCGALAMHAGNEQEALDTARTNVRAFKQTGLKHLVTTAAGCGAMIREYGRLLANDPELAEDARRMSEAAADVSELLVEQGYERPRPPKVGKKKVVYHDACHLLHAVGVSVQPRQIAAAAAGGKVADLGENSICCGSAGSYNLDHRKMGLLLGARKAELAVDCDAEIVAVGNVGCILQLERALAQAGEKTRVLHPVEMLAAAYQPAIDSD
jgi:glycolate oxidase iron-sulfur subunit